MALDPTNGRYARKVPVLAAIQLGPTMAGWLSIVVSRCHKEGTTYAGTRTFAQDAGRTQRAANVAIKRLIASGWLQVVPNPPECTSPRARNLYAPFLVVDKWVPRVIDDFKGESLSAPSRVIHRADGESFTTSNQYLDQDIEQSATLAPTPNGRAIIADIRAGLVARGQPATARPLVPKDRGTATIDGRPVVDVVSKVV